MTMSSPFRGRLGRRGAPSACFAGTSPWEGEDCEDGDVVLVGAGSERGPLRLLRRPAAQWLPRRLRCASRPAPCSPWEGKDCEDDDVFNVLVSAGSERAQTTRTAVPSSSVSLDQVVRSVSASEQGDESGTNPAIPRPPSPSMPRPDSRPGTRHQPLNPANHRPSAPGPHRGSRGTYGVVPRPEGPGEDGVLPGKQGVSGTESPADAQAVSPEPTSTEDTVFCRWSVRLVRVGDP